MADRSRNRTPVEILIGFIQTQLAAITPAVDVETFYVEKEEELFKYLYTIKPDEVPVVAVNYPAVVLKNEPQSIYTFHLYIITKDWGSLSNALASAQAVRELVYPALDFQLYPDPPVDLINGSPSKFYFDRDDQRPIDLNGKNMVYRLTLYCEDY
jgi:hypothetical protein